MKTVFVKQPAVSYTDYAILYRQTKGTTKGCLKLITFCNKMKKGKGVIVGDTMFCVPPSGIEGQGAIVITIK